jgi:hypothetical protein
LTTKIPASDTANAGTLNEQVVNPSPGGSSSSALPFTVSAPTFSIVTSPTQPGIAGIPQSAPVPLTVVPTGGFVRNVTLSLQPNAANVTGSFTATTIAPNNPGGVRYAVPVGTSPGTYHVAIQGDDGEGDDNSQDGDVVVQDVDVIVLDITPYFADFLAVLDDGTVFPYFEAFVDGSDADLVTNQVYQARYQPPNGPVSAFQSGVDSIGSTPSTTSFSAFSLPQSGFGQYTFWMTQVMTVDYGGQYLFAAQLSTAYNYSSISPNSMQLGAVANVTFSGTGLGTPDEGLDIYGGILSINICYSGVPPINNNCATATNLTGQLSPPQPFLGAEAPNATNTIAAATLDATSANTNTGMYWVSLNVFGQPTNWLQFTVGDATPYISAITNTDGSPIGSLQPGTPTYIKLLGSGFGAQPGTQGTVNICVFGANPCVGSDVSVTLVGSWSDQEIDLLVTSSATSQGTYDVQVTSGGVTGNGFLNNAGGNGAASNRQQVIVGSVQLALTRPSLMQFQASAIPAGGQFTESLALLSGVTTTGFGSSTITTSGNIETLVVPLLDPPSPSKNGAPSPGGLALITISYQSPSGSTVYKNFNVATFGTSCYNSALESDWGTPPSACRSVTINPNSYSGSATNPPGNLQGTFCSAFLGEIRLQGSGVAGNGQLIQYNAREGAWNSVSQILTADLTPLIPNGSVARDRAIITGKGVLVSIDNPPGTGLPSGLNLLANDLGASIIGYRLDLFLGPGNASCPVSGYPNLIVVGACSPGLSTCPSSP